MSWKIFEENAPELAALGVEKLDRTITYLALLRNDGSPRINPVTPFIGDGKLFMFTNPGSPKIKFLKRDGRYAMHNAVSRDGPLLEYLVSGRVKIITDATIRAKAEDVANSPQINDSQTLFEFLVEGVLVVEYDEDMKPIVHRWTNRRASND